MAVLTISRKYTLEAAHQLPHVDALHKCGRLHGHTYQIEVEVGGYQLPRMGWAIDFFDLDLAWEESVHSRLDHRLLNEVEGLENPTTENLLLWIAPRLRARLPEGIGLVEMRAGENPDSMVRWRPGRDGGEQ